MYICQKVTKIRDKPEAFSCGGYTTELELHGTESQLSSSSS